MGPDLEMGSGPAAIIKLKDSLLGLKRTSYGECADILVRQFLYPGAELLSSIHGQTMKSDSQTYNNLAARARDSAEQAVGLAPQSYRSKRHSRGEYYADTLTDHLSEYGTIAGC